MTSTNQTLSSTSVRIRYPKDRAPTTVQSATAALVEFGEIARLDVSLSALNGFVLVTYFDVRSAHLALAAHAGYAETFSAASHDFRRVRIIPSALQEAVARSGGFHTFGEIASVSRNGDHIELEFFDLRCAHKVIFTVTGSEPVRGSDTAQQVQEPTSVDLAAAHRQTLARIDHLCTLMHAKAAAQNNSQGTGESAAAKGIKPDSGAAHHLSLDSAFQASTRPAAGADAPRPFTQQLARALYPQQPVSGTTARLLPGSLAFPLAPGLAPSMLAGVPAQIPLSVGPTVPAWDPRPAPGLSAPTAVLASAGAAAGILPRPLQTLQKKKKMKAAKTEVPDEVKAKPVREKVSGDEHLEFEIDPQQIQKGEDQRTTVMVRNIPKTCSREDFVKFLVRSRLADKYNFLYMPFDKRRNIRCGFAFVNFVSPDHVLRLFEALQAGAWQELMEEESGSTPAVSYARLQGLEDLTQHFSVSAVMKDNDQRKRPVFVTSGGETSELGSDERTSSQVSFGEPQNSQGPFKVYVAENAEGGVHSGLVGA